MLDHQLIETTQNYLRIAIPMMSRYKIPITPQNYDVWYQYVSGINGELKETIDTMLQENKPFTEEVNDRLYNKYCSEIDEGALKRLQEDLKEILASVLGELSLMTGKAEKYNNVLSHSITKLSDELSIEAVKFVLKEILGETKSISRYNIEIQHKLRQTTSELETMQREFERTKMEACTDFLTGVANRKALAENFELLAAGAVHENKPLSLLLLDIDHFKKFNDKHGHLIGDEILKFVCKILKEHVRGRDFVARYGGEEFVLLLPLTQLDGAKILAENIRCFFEQANLQVKEKSKPLGRITISIGVSCYRHGETLENFIHRADKALYYAKKSGRNKVISEIDIEP